MHHCNTRQEGYQFGRPLALLAICRVAENPLGNNRMTRDGLVSNGGLFSPMATSPFEPSIFIFLPLSGCHTWQTWECCDQRSLIGTCHLSTAYAQTTHQLAGDFLNSYVIRAQCPDLGEPLVWSGQPLEFVRSTTITYQELSRDTYGLCPINASRGSCLVQREILVGSDAHLILSIAIVYL